MKKHKVVIVSLLLSSALVLSFLYLNRPHVLTNEDFKEHKIEEEREGKEEEEARPGYADKMLEWYYEQRSYPTGQIPEEWRSRALKQINKNNLQLKKTASTLSWTQLGPGNIGGRIRSIIVDPRNSSVIYAGSVAGGIWKTTNGGNSWFALDDHMENLSIGSLVMDPSNPDVIYAGTGEGFANIDALRGEGIFKSQDAGKTWTRLSSTLSPDFYYVNKLAFDKTTNTLWAATRRGLFKSTDGGNTFNVVTSLPNSSNVHATDIVISYDTPSRIYVAFGLFNTAVIYESADAGKSFQQVFTAPGNGRTVLAASASNPKVVYLSAMKLSDNTAGIMRVTKDGGASWDSLKVPGPSLSGSSTYTSNQAWYDNIIAVDPQDPNTVYAGGLDFWKSQDGGKTWTQKTNWYTYGGYAYVHADHHAMTIDPSNSNNIYLGTDGGIFKSTNKGSGWTDLNNNLFVTQFYYGAVDPASNKYYGGAQDNGTIKSDGGTDWYEILSGDGGAVEVDYNNPNTIYMEYVDLAVYKSTDGGQHYTKAMTGIPVSGTDEWSGTSDRVQFIAPFAIDPNNPNTLVAGTYRVYKTTNGASNWSAVSGDLTGDGTGPSGAKISTVVIAKGNSDVIYAGCSNGVVGSTQDGGKTWNTKGTGLPNLSTTKIAVDSKDPAAAYAAFSGYSDGQKVFKTTDYGASWTNISGNLPNVPVNCILVNKLDNKNLAVGTDLGVFTSADGGGSWVQNNDGLANVSVADLDYRDSDNRIFAATHGRGMFSAQWNFSTTLVDESTQKAPESFDLAQNYPNPFNPSTTIKYQIPEAANVKVTVYDVTGKQVAELVNDYKQAGHYEVSWTGHDNSGHQVASGIYLYTIQAGSFTKSMKMMLLK
ncbi:MAG TPA: FlgD immunoglobulin-like domain containing protein [Ignavibacteriales bacterium]|nr:FlgD immunoglobulin-like domain containing protein [Ignavibacteriales bacterium]